MLHRNTLYPLKYELFNYQHEACDFIRRNERVRNTMNSGALVVMRMGLGKTLCALTCVSLTLKHQRRIREQTLYISLASTLLDVQAQCCKFYSIHMSSYVFNYNIHRTHITYDQKRHGSHVIHTRLQRADLVIMSYATLRSLWLCRHHQDQYHQLVFGTAWYRIIFDESHMLMNGDTKLYSAVSELKAHRKFAMTGTVMRHTIYDVLYQLHTLNVVNSVHKNESSFALIQQTTRFWDFDVLNITIQLNFVEYEEDRALTATLMNWIHSKATYNLAHKQITLIFCTNPILIKAICKRLHNASVYVSTITHTDSLQKRSKSIQSHHQKFTTPFVLINTCIAAYGIDLSFASNIVFTDTCHNDPIRVQQCVYRVKRPGFKSTILPITCIVPCRTTDKQFMSRNILISNE